MHLFHYPSFQYSGRFFTGISKGRYSFLLYRGRFGKLIPVQPAIAVDIKTVENLGRHFLHRGFLHGYVPILVGVVQFPGGHDNLTRIRFPSRRGFRENQRRKGESDDDQRNAKAS
ncbi:hypothetical protein Nmul_A0653 [Nitrosospira multiformis ATCC 25196]|uniref:Uncharacterized protein n=1 Tax=Nitrosospira multiformis (strain ATCC 25196 / NCIMB 11849 / C 71) TaxID=323848 RepID=Q2YBB1_NITMU|nr:hypothetical protein Nmul_A0653 [Nitrosospira multiformis ATCC 25196]